MSNERRSKEGSLELWKYVRGYEGAYKVSNLGAVFSCRTAKLLSPHLDDSGYPRIGLWDGKAQRKFRVHVLVAEAFHGGKQNALHREVAHLDGNRENPRADNLKWVSHVENHSHRRAHGTHPAGENHPRAKLTDAAVLAIRASTQPYRELADRFGVGPYAISDVKRGRRWAHVTANRG